MRYFDDHTGLIYDLSYKKCVFIEKECLWPHFLEGTPSRSFPKTMA